jgi:hypothetical protein
LPVKALKLKLKLTAKIMLNQELPIKLTHEGILLDKTGRKWSKGKYPPNTVPYELTEDVRGKNFEASEDQKYDKVPTLGEEKEPELKLETKEDKPAAARVAQPAAAIPAPPAA